MLYKGEIYLFIYLFFLGSTFKKYIVFFIFGEILMLI
jgi:hypothetical protein